MNEKELLKEFEEFKEEFKEFKDFKLRRNKEQFDDYIKWKETFITFCECFKYSPYIRSYEEYMKDKKTYDEMKIIMSEYNKNIDCYAYWKLYKDVWKTNEFGFSSGLTGAINHYNRYGKSEGRKWGADIILNSIHDLNDESFNESGKKLYTNIYIVDSFDKLKSENENLKKEVFMLKNNINQNLLYINDLKKELSENRIMISEFQSMKYEWKNYKEEKKLKSKKWKKFFDKLF